MKTDTILLDHGGGGVMSHRLVTELLLPIFDNPILSQLHDGAVFDINGQRLAFSTDTFVVDPILFPGGPNSMRTRCRVLINIFHKMHKIYC